MNIHYNQRTDERSHYEVPVIYSRQDGEECYQGMLINCSDHGVCMMTDYPYLPDSRLNIKTVFDLETVPIEVVWNKVEHNTTFGVTSYRIGARFAESEENH